MTTTIASVNCYGGFLKTNPKILRTFFTYILEAQQFTLAKVTLNQVLSTQVNSSCLDKVQNMSIEKILSADFFSLELVNGAKVVCKYSYLEAEEYDLYNFSTYLSIKTGKLIWTSVFMKNEYLPIL